MKDKFDEVPISQLERLLEMVGNGIALLMLIAFFLKIVVF